MLKNYWKDDLDSTSWIGEVVDIADPLKEGRVKVKVYGKFDQIPTEHIPWAYPANNMTAGSATGGGFFSVPKLKSLVAVRFDNGNIYHPEYTFQQKISAEVKSEIENSYDNAHIIIYDTVTEGKLKIFFTEEKGVMIDYKESQINIKPDKSIHLVSKEKVVVDCLNIELGDSASSSALQAIIKGESFMKFFNSHTHTGPVGPPALLMSSSLLSQTTKSK